jgi:hypothetical protein
MSIGSIKKVGFKIPALSARRDEGTRHRKKTAPVFSGGCCNAGYSPGRDFEIAGVITAGLRIDSVPAGCEGFF